jgi:muconolactone delta-isomerase
VQGDLQAIGIRLLHVIIATNRCNDWERAMRFFVRMTEGRSSTTVELAAMLEHRLKSIDYQRALLDRGKLGYAFRNVDGDVSYLMYKADSLEELDALIKADPSWPFCETEVVPVTTTAAMIREIEASMGPNVLSAKFTNEEMKHLDSDEEPIDEEGVYSLAEKALPSMSALTSPSVLDEIWQRTVTSQSLHINSIEFADHNPVGRPWGLLIGKVEPDALKQHVSTAPIFPDTTVTYTRLHTLKQAWEASAKQTVALHRAVSPSAFYGALLP